MDVTAWQDSLNVLTQPGGWLASRDRKTQFALEALAGYATPAGWIGHSFEATAVRTAEGNDAFPKPDAAYAAESRRDAVLQLALVHELMGWQPGHDHADDDLAPMIDALCGAALVADTGLRPKAAQRTESGRAEVDFAHSENAKTFFEEIIGRRLANVDAKLHCTLATAAGERYDPANDASITRWGRAWTAGVALVPLDWARARQCRTARQAARLLWYQANPAGEVVPRFYPRGAMLPTASKNAHIELRTRPAIAYAIEGSETLRMLSDDVVCSLPFALKALDYVATGSRVLYHGRNVLQLYVATWSDCLCVANRGIAMSKPADLRASGHTEDAQETIGLAPEQRLALGLTSTARLRAIGLDPPKARRTGPVDTRPGLPKRAAPPLRDNPVEQALGWDAVPNKRLQFVRATGVAGSPLQPLGSIQLWSHLPDLEWIDVFVVARIEGRQEPLPILLERVAGEGEPSGRTTLVLDEPASPVGADALRNALEQSDALIMVVVKRGLGAFVVLEIDMGRPRSDDVLEIPAFIRRQAD